MNDFTEEELIVIRFLIDNPNVSLSEIEMAAKSKSQSFASDDFDCNQSKEQHD